MTDMKNADKPINPFYHKGSMQTENTIDKNRPHLLGLTKREYFAAMAMQGLLTRIPYIENWETDLGFLESKRIAVESIIMADELLKQLES